MTRSGQRAGVLVPALATAGAFPLPKLGFPDLGTHDPDPPDRAVVAACGRRRNRTAALTLLPGPALPGVVKVRLLYPEDEYLEKRCRRILADWLATTDVVRRDAAPADRRKRSGTLT